MDIVWVAGRQRTKNNQDFTRGMSREMAATESGQKHQREAQVLHAASRKLDRVLEARFARGLQFMSVSDRFQNILRVSCETLGRPILQGMR